MINVQEKADCECNAPKQVAVFTRGEISNQWDYHPYSRLESQMNQNQNPLNEGTLPTGGGGNDEPQ